MRRQNQIKEATFSGSFLFPCNVSLIPGQTETLQSVQTKQRYLIARPKRQVISWLNRQLPVLGKKHGVEIKKRSLAGPVSAAGRLGELADCLAVSQPVLKEKNVLNQRGDADLSWD